MKPTREVTVAFWNILSDVNDPSLVKSQSERLPDIIKTLQKLPKRTIIGLAEVESKSSKLLARQLGSRSAYFVEHERQDNHIGVLSQEKLVAKFIKLDDKCRAVVVEYNDMTIAIVHLTLVLFNESSRKKQISTLLSHLDLTKPLIIMGDFNSMCWQGSRRLLLKAGFHPALRRTLTNRLPTAPTKKYSRILPQPLRTLAHRGFTLDDIYIKGLEAVDSGTFEGESDHRGVWARVGLR
jgi:endonuclease/exonuclease/phosphatase family metal-dependent hydrolase